MENINEKSNDYGDFEEISSEDQNKSPQEITNSCARVRLPKENELIGIVVERLGGKRMSVKATDGKTRNARVPGRFNRKFWLRPGQAVIIQPWEFDDEQADIIHQYKPNEISQLKKYGLLDKLNEEF